MANMAFVIPTSLADLLREAHSNYCVKDVFIVAELFQKMEESENCYRDEGPNFILTNFDTYYSVLHHAKKLRPDVVHKAYKLLGRATVELNNLLLLLLEDKDNLNEELKSKTVNVIKMLVYIYVQFIIYLEEKKRRTQDDILGRGGKNKDKNTADAFAVNKTQALIALNNIIQREINVFWEPPIVEHDLVGLISELCIVLLQNPNVKQEKNVIMEIFGVFGNLVKFYDYGKTLVTRLIRTIRMYEHVVHCVIDGIKLLVEQFNCHTLIHHFVKEATEWQLDESFQDNQGTKCCSIFLVELAATLPEQVLPEVVPLSKYLAHESVPLRTAILSVINEMVLQVLKKHDLNDEEKELRDEFFDVLVEHVRDVSSAVRSKVIQNLSRLQKENAIPLTLQNEVLVHVIEHLKDKTAAVRKSAIQCVTTFLEHNPYGANLKLKKVQIQLAEKKELLHKMEATYKAAETAKLEQRETEWATMEGDLKEVVEQQLRDEDEEEIEELPELEPDQAVEQIRNLLLEKEYKKAFLMAQKFKNCIDECKNMRRGTEEQELSGYMTILHSFFVNKLKFVENLRTDAGMTAEDIEKIKTLEGIITFFENTVEFLQIIDSTMSLMKSLLFSQTMSDTHEAINFFIRAYQFQIDNASYGILEMLKIMRCVEQERQTAVVEAFKSIYLTTDTKTMAEHTATILTRLLNLLKDLAYDNIDDFECIVAEWTTKGILDNNVIDRCWQYFTQRESVTDDDARAAAEILRMAAMGRISIISRNITVVSKILFSEQHKDDLMFTAACCRLLAVAGWEKIDVQSENPPMKIKHSYPIFEKLTKVLVDEFFEKKSYYSQALKDAIDFIFKVCSKPIEIVETIISQITEKLQDHPKTIFLLIRLCNLLGFMAIKLLSYLDNNVYRELKRRNYVREERKKQGKDAGKKNNKSRQTIHSLLNASSMSETNSGESVLMGAEAEDTDAELILSVLENDVVSERGILGQYSGFIVDICGQVDVYSDSLLQQSAVTALMRYMLVSSIFCRENIQLLFTILEKTSHAHIKCTILVHCSDLLTRFPNIVEPWSHRIYAMLKDSLVEVRKKAFFALANLILRDMIRAHSHIAEMAICLIDDNQEVNEMCKNFFERMASKEHNLVNIIPDIFTHLIRTEDIGQEDLRYILKFLFDLVDNSKRMENLVDRFCCKYTPDENHRLNNNITYCLSLINYNDKTLRKLHEKLPMYQHHLHDADIYAYFQQILAECGKAKPGKSDLRPIVAELEASIASVFEVSENGQPPPRRPPKLTKKGRVAASARKPRKKSKKQSSSDSDSDRSIEPKKTARKRTAGVSSDSD